MTSSDLSVRIHEAALFIEQLPAAPSDGGPKALEPLFRRLREGAVDERSAAEASIWQIWCDHQDSTLAAAMERAMVVMNAGMLDQATAILDELVESESGWAEAWNKRATLYFVLGRDAESVSDIRRTLELEPRHFGALCGFAQIAGRNADPHAAQVALERALAVHPELPGVRSTIERLRGRRSESLH